MLKIYKLSTLSQKAPVEAKNYLRSEFSQNGGFTYFPEDPFKGRQGHTALKPVKLATSGDSGDERNIVWINWRLLRIENWTSH